MGGFIMKVTSYLLSKQLAEAGFEANAEFYWTELNGDLFLIHKTQLFSVPISIKKIPAYDLETIWDALPKFYENSVANIPLALYEDCIGYLSNTWDNDGLEVEKKENESLADAAARLWLLTKKGKRTI
jgi:hypothetical protein